jgi:hypothetical protein
LKTVATDRIVCLSPGDVKNRFYLGGYGTEAHGHLGAPHIHHPAPAREPVPVPPQTAEEAA